MKDKGEEQSCYLLQLLAPITGGTGNSYVTVEIYRVTASLRHKKMGAFEILNVIRMDILPVSFCHGTPIAVVLDQRSVGNLVLFQVYLITNLLLNFENVRIWT